MSKTASVWVAACVLVPLVSVSFGVVGAIGVGGAKGSEKDEACAVAGLQKIKSRLR